MAIKTAALALLLGMARLQNVESLSCNLYDDLAMYNLSPLQKDGGYLKNGYRFNFCQLLNVTDEDTGALVYTYAINREGKPMTHLQLPSKVETLPTTEVPPEPTHVKVTYNSQIDCESSWVSDPIYWKTVFEVFCDAEGSRRDVLTAANFTVTEQDCTLRISTRHRAGCPTVQALGIFKFFSENPHITGLLLIAMGTVANFFGGKFFPYICTGGSALITFCVINLLLSIAGGYKVFNQDVNFGWYLAAVLCFCFSVIVAGGASYLTWKKKRIGAVYFGGCIGFLFGYYIYKLVFSELFESKFFAFMIMVAATAGTAWYSFKWSKTLTVPTTAAIGSFAMIYGVSLFLGGLPESLEEYRDGAAQFTMEDSYVIYLFAFILLMVAGVLHQRHRKYHELYDNEFQFWSADQDNYMRYELK